MKGMAMPNPVCRCFPLILVIISTIARAQGGDAPTVFIKDGSIWYTSSARIIFPDGTNKLPPKLSPDSREVLVVGASSARGQAGTFPVYVVGLDGSVKFQKDITGSNGPVGSVTDSGWAGADRFYVVMELAPSVLEMQTFKKADGKLIDCVHGYGFVWNASGSAVAAMDYVQMGKPAELTVDTVLVNDHDVYEAPGSQADGVSVMSNLVWSGDGKDQTLSFVEREKDGTKRLVTLTPIPNKKWGETKPKVNKTELKFDGDEAKLSIDKAGKPTVGPP
jgi:hypothetical protein